MPEITTPLHEQLARLDPALPEIVRGSEMPSLAHGPTQPAIKDWIESHPEAPAAVRSGLWLLAGDLDRSHDISQTLPDASGSFLHGIMHRRESDYPNAKYWFRQAGRHDVEIELADQFPGYRSASQFVDACEDAAGDESHDADSCRRLQWSEWCLLMSALLTP